VGSQYTMFLSENQIADVKLQLLKLGQNKCLIYMNW
jgi:hypothetical protein